ncbi:transporter [Candidatus Roizmanbacteria bacterium CG_4_8_14_3_um_filter_34_9]|uniref:Transporter n=3 Tax=Candidatus Roizmaniibacteriota TaxID=1752723 RepID=A0A2M7AVE5_9BACT|nr:MAG: transporter [Candidatus Roizmanbacteria bacterium CG07_land_8_20_14_0_80_34_15]PIU74523.1 MAG: transporter [Candidatus Roizmanbacteria bacterium CG06_land_8_20_14_3_00_34_14]PIW73625.1 MAG: transporter [Candidatus Roizmanbacteria bacterium CG_4_8_14_3_um_filter_34_9]
MDIFLALLYKLIPLYLIIGLGYLSGRVFKVTKESIAPLLIYIIAPIIIFNGVVTTKLNISSLSLPILFFILACFICLLFYFIGKTFWKDSTVNILAFTAGTGNTGYFGLPVALILFDKNLIGLVVMSILGFVLYENSLGFFITAKGHHTIKESLIKVMKLPAIYAFFFGLAINLSKIPLNQIYIDTISNFKGAYTILGMMLIGLGLASIKEFAFDFKFVSLTFLAKFIIWPLIVMLVVWVDNITLQLYNTSIHKVMILMSIVPLAANTVAFATELKAQPEKASLAVMLSTLFALFYIPLITLSFF